MVIQNRVDSSGIRNPLYFYFVEANDKTPADSGFHWNMADSSGIHWNRHDANALYVNGIKVRRVENKTRPNMSEHYVSVESMESIMESSDYQEVADEVMLRRYGLPDTGGLDLAFGGRRASVDSSSSTTASSDNGRNAGEEEQGGEGDNDNANNGNAEEETVTVVDPQHPQDQDPSLLLLNLNDASSLRAVMVEGQQVDAETAKQNSTEAEESLERVQSTKIEHEVHLKELERQVAECRAQISKCEGQMFHHKERCLKRQLQMPCKWNTMFELLLEYKQNQGDTLVPHAYKDNRALGRFVGNQRVFYKYYQNGDTKHIKAHRIDVLNRIGFVWNPKEEMWLSKWRDLKAFKHKHGHLKVPFTKGKKHADPHIDKLSKWIDLQRDAWCSLKRGEHSTLTAERIEKLESMGFVFARTRTGGSQLSSHLNLHGDTSIPKGRTNNRKRQRTSVPSSNTTAAGSASESTAIIANIDIGNMHDATTNLWGAHTKDLTAEELWHFRYEQLKEFHRIYGHVSVNKRALTNEFRANRAASAQQRLERQGQEQDQPIQTPEKAHCRPANEDDDEEPQSEPRAQTQASLSAVAASINSRHDNSDSDCNHKSPTARPHESGDSQKDNTSATDKNMEEEENDEIQSNNNNDKDGEESGTTAANAPTPPTGASTTDGRPPFVVARVPLVGWLACQRNQYDYRREGKHHMHSLTEDKIALLEELGIKWRKPRYEPRKS
jgi:hypothetical protein